MRKVFKSLLYLSVGLTLVLSSCSKDKDEKGSGEVAGSYSVEVSIYGTDVDWEDLSTTLTVSKDGDNLKTSGSVTSVQLGKIDLNLVLSSLQTYSGKEAGVSYTECLYKIAQQSIKIGSKTANFKGTGEYENYDGAAGSAGSYKYLFFNLSGEVEGIGTVYINVSTSDDDDF